MAFLVCGEFCGESGFWGAVGAIPLSLVVWQWREKKYKRHMAQFEQHT
ncbi:hypothetical protein [Vibrio parahaemolyticus]